MLALPTVNNSGARSCLIFNYVRQDCVNTRVNFVFFINYKRIVRKIRATRKMKFSNFVFNTAAYKKITVVAVLHAHSAIWPIYVFTHFSVQTTRAEVRDTSRNTNSARV